MSAKVKDLIAALQQEDPEAPLWVIGPDADGYDWDYMTSFKVEEVLQFVPGVVVVEGREEKSNDPDY